MTPVRDEVAREIQRVRDALLEEVEENKYAYAGVCAHILHGTTKERFRMACATLVEEGSHRVYYVGAPATEGVKIRPAIKILARQETPFGEVVKDREKIFAMHNEAIKATENRQ